MKSPFSRPRSAAFSLLEVLMVIAIMAIVARFLIPAVGQLVRGTPLTQAAQIVSAEFAQARQYAVTKNRPVEVRFIQFADPEIPGELANDPSTGKFRAIQLMEVLESGALVALDKPRVLINPVMMNSGSGSLSTLLDPTVLDATRGQKLLKGSDANNGQPAEANPPMPRGVDRNYQYIPFRFLPNGSTDLSQTGQQWYLTLHTTRDVVVGTTLPPNYFLVQIDPVNGTLRNFRPGIQ